MKNVAILIIDAVRPRNLSVYGYSKETDRTLKEIAREGLVFNDHYSVSNATFGSITSLFTGLYPPHHGIIHQAPYIKDEEYEKLSKIKFWLPSYLQKNGYHTIGIDWIGLWFKKGFDYYGEREKFKNPKSKNLMRKILFKMPPIVYKIGKKFKKKKPLFASAEESIDLAISKVKESGEKPFFLFMHMEDTHFPFPNVEKVKKGERDMKEHLKKMPSSQRNYIEKRLNDIGLDSLQDIKDSYDEAIKSTDKEIGRLVSFLKEEKKWEDTIFIVIADHGDSLDEHGIYFSHSGLFDETIHVPLVMHLPGFSGKRINGFVQNIDLIPTILENINLEIPRGIDGRSFMPLIKEGKPIRSKIFSFDGLAEDIKCERTKSHKIIKGKNTKCNLCGVEHHSKNERYDLVEDPQEENNISNT